MKNNDYLNWTSVTKPTNNSCSLGNIPHPKADSTDPSQEDPNRVFSLSNTENIIRDVIKKMSPPESL